MTELRVISRQGKANQFPFWACDPLQSKAEKDARLRGFSKSLQQAIANQDRTLLQQIFRDTMPYKITAYGFPVMEIPTFKVPVWAERFRRIWIENSIINPVTVSGLMTLLNGLEEETKGLCSDAHPWRANPAGVAQNRFVKFADFREELLVQTAHLDRIDIGILLEILIFRYRQQVEGLLRITPLNINIPSQADFSFKIRNELIWFSE